MIPFIRKYPWLTILVLLAVTQLSWLWMAPEDFKATWSKNSLVANIIKEHNSIQEKSKLLTLSYYATSFSYFANIINGTQEPDKDQMGGAIYTYYQMANQLLPDIDSAHYLLGYCEYYRGNLDEALAQYKRSIDLDPYFFWSYYNLGVIYFRQGDFLNSAEVLSRAFSLKNEITLGVLHQNPFYQQIWRYIDDPGPILESNLSEGQKDAALLLADCLVRAGAGPQALQIIQHVGQSGPWHQELWKRLNKKVLSRSSALDDLDRLIQEQIPVRLF